MCWLYTKPGCVERLHSKPNTGTLKLERNLQERVSILVCRSTGRQRQRPIWRLTNKTWGPARGWRGKWRKSISLKGKWGNYVNVRFHHLGSGEILAIRLNFASVIIQKRRFCPAWCINCTPCLRCNLQMWCTQVTSQLTCGPEVCAVSTHLYAA